ncbi:MAG: Mrp/NBP35 family ATP-binding protein [Clostridia bacterium]|nr:Mrp/NBP35 family ATP-binding protein [Clostridiales bacterium]MCR5805085.1 Mrp/NBP35 family ATP-binding protein [Clostridia bacterium]
MSACDSCPSKASCTSQSSCPSANGDSQSQAPQSLLEEINKFSSVKKVIGVCSGKGGVGKSLVTSILASRLARDGYNVGILDADITGPSIPKAFGLKGSLKGDENKNIIPAVTHSGIKAVSVNLLLENDDAPVLWRGPVIAGLVKQFWTDVNWGTLDVLLIDMPPGTGDVPLTVFQSIPVDGIVLVSTPQDLVSMIVNKARNMALMMQVKVLGFVENMSYVKCGKCGEEIKLFGDNENVKKAAEEMGVSLLDKLPLDPDITKLVDAGEIEKIPQGNLDGTVKLVESMLEG